MAIHAVVAMTSSAPAPITDPHASLGRMTRNTDTAIVATPRLYSAHCTLAAAVRADPRADADGHGVVGARGDLGPAADGVSGIAIGGSDTVVAPSATP